MSATCGSERLDGRSILEGLALCLVAVALMAPLYSFPSPGTTGRSPVYAWKAVLQTPLLGLAVAAPILALALLRWGMRRGWQRLSRGLVPLLLLGSTLTLVLESTLALRSIPLPFCPLPLLYAGSRIGPGCWAFLLAGALLLASWGLGLSPPRTHPPPARR